MAETRSLSTSLRHLGRILLAGDLDDLSDAELVGRFVERRDEAAFTALVRRHGMVVLGVCRRVLRHQQDAEDAFQATFLVLARDAASLRRAAAVGNWLDGVAYNVARKARSIRERRAIKEREAAARQPSATRADGDDLREVLDRELHALPDRYRAPIVLCDLMGLTTGEAATEVGCPPKTLGTRLSRARSLLARRLLRRGVALSAGALVAALGPSATATVPRRLLDSTVQVATGPCVPPAIVALTQGVSNVMLLNTVKSLAVLICGVVAVAGLSVGILYAASEPTKPGLTPVVPAAEDKNDDKPALPG